MNMEFYRKLTIPKEIKEQYPLSPELAALKKAQEKAEKEAAEKVPAKQPAHAASDSLLGLEETEPGVAGPAKGSSPAPKPDSTPIELSPVMDQKVEEAATRAAIQLVPKKPSLWQRIKFLFTGRLD